MESKEYYYKLEKLEIEAGKYSQVREGYSQAGSLAVGNKVTGVQKNADFKDIKKGSQVLVLGRSFGDFLVTSPVSEFIEQGEDFIKFKTRTSIYMLTRHEEE